MNSVTFFFIAFKDILRYARFTEELLVMSNHRCKEIDIIRVIEIQSVEQQILELRVTNQILLKKNWLVE